MNENSYKTVENAYKYANSSDIITHTEVFVNPNQKEEDNLYGKKL